MLSWSSISMNYVLFNFSLQYVSVFFINFRLEHKNPNVKDGCFNILYLECQNIKLHSIRSVTHGSQSHIQYVHAVFILIFIHYLWNSIWTELFHLMFCTGIDYSFLFVLKYITCILFIWCYKSCLKGAKISVPKWIFWLNCML